MMANIYDPPRSKWLYPDRGMVKWLGFFLSDHTKALEKDEVTGEPISVPRAPQDERTIGDALDEAYLTGVTAHIQLAILHNDHLVPDIVGTVAGFTDDDCVLVYTDDGARQVDPHQIRNVQLAAPDKWYRQGVTTYGDQ
ncbi:hypothetical protein FD09_GL002873 [Schleiferilactobacillus perolens DSM 12744]|uniref:DNA-directed RNA polymerase beta subunit n=2 Tax=Schleiferilactobacillus perolens TaxID=100468 RepID=A0A0R1N547_9LACO|nr:hypothetical protein FD09_GL002873 [Schleiferilactobacillus perolens DSM 12744]